MNDSKERVIRELKLPYVNSVTISGRLTSDPDMRYNENTNPMCKFRIACNDVKIKDGVKREYTTFVNVVSWGKKAEYCNDKLKKGHPVLIQGELASNTYTDDVTGKNITYVDIIADRVQVLQWDKTNE